MGNIEVQRADSRWFFSISPVGILQMRAEFLKNSGINSVRKLAELQTMEEIGIMKKEKVQIRQKSNLLT